VRAMFLHPGALSAAADHFIAACRHATSEPTAG
jgi:hypothetical protein